MPNLTFLVGALLVVVGGYAYTQSVTRSPVIDRSSAWRNHDPVSRSGVWR